MHKKYIDTFRECYILAVIQAKKHWCNAILTIFNGRYQSMEYTEITKQVIDFQKMSFSNWYNAVAMVQDQTTSAMDMVLDQSTWVPEEGRKAVQSWLGACQQERNRFKAYVDEGFTSMEKYLAKGGKAVSAKSKTS